MQQYQHNIYFECPRMHVFGRKAVCVPFAIKDPVDQDQYT